MQLTHYQREIVQVTGCPAEDAADVEDIMRNVIFHSTLDWQTKAEFARGAREAVEVLHELRKEGLYSRRKGDADLRP